MNGYILTGHGKFASGLYSSLKLISGTKANMHVINFEEDTGINDYKIDLEKAIEDLENCNRIIIFTDIPGGTPFNQSVYLTQKKSNTIVIGGTNLSLLLELTLTESKDTEEIMMTIKSVEDDGFLIYE